MFCNTTRSAPDFNEQIEEVMKFFDGKVTEHDSLVGISGGSRAVDDGKTTKLTITPKITGIVTDAGKKYEIMFYSHLINSEDKDKVGISELSITTDDGAECIVGKYIR